MVEYMDKEQRKAARRELRLKLDLKELTQEEYNKKELEIDLAKVAPKIDKQKSVTKLFESDRTKNERHFQWLNKMVKIEAKKVQTFKKSQEHSDLLVALFQKRIENANKRIENLNKLKERFVLLKQKYQAVELKHKQSCEKHLVEIENMKPLLEKESKELISVK